MGSLIVPLIMCGGAGTRLWPASREGRPKQFLPLFGPRSTFQDTIVRLSNRSLFARPIVITNSQYRFLVADQLAEIDAEADILLEPVRRDSGPAIAAGTAFAQRRDSNAVVLVLAADHVVNDTPAFVDACRTALPPAEAGRIVTFGVHPQQATTEYGYIRPGAPLGNRCFAVDKFVEKPDQQTAHRYIAEGYLWNSGNFMFRSDQLLAEYNAFQSESAAAAVEAVEASKTDLGFVILDKEAFARAQAISIDYAIMERTANAAVLPVSYEWSDVGSWHAVWQLAAKDANANAALGKVLFLDTSSSYVASDKAVVAVLGVENLVVVASADAVLVAHRDRAADLRKVVERLKTMAPEVTQEHLKVYRPWGSYQLLESGDRYQVKRIVVKPQGRLSLQKHLHRAEHWVVVRGTAQVTVGDSVKTLHENESTYIPIGSAHRLENPGKIDLELIEVQSGSYLGEDDIVRFDDDYHRS
jgi:mannose-1-phosphate guanylyltransferase/mannose-6-phosphate isomerase